LSEAFAVFPFSQLGERHRILGDPHGWVHCTSRSRNGNRARMSSNPISGNLERPDSGPLTKARHGDAAGVGLDGGRWGKTPSPRIWQGNANSASLKYGSQARSNHVCTTPPGLAAPDLPLSPNGEVLLSTLPQAQDSASQTHGGMHAISARRRSKRGAFAMGAWTRKGACFPRTCDWLMRADVLRREHPSVCTVRTGHELPRYPSPRPRSDRCVPRHLFPVK
jgi:hypothetical protein